MREMTLGFDLTTGGVKAAPVPLTESVRDAIHQDAADRLRAALEVLAEAQGEAALGPIGDVSYKAVISAAHEADQAARLLHNTAA